MYQYDKPRAKNCKGCGKKLFGNPTSHHFFCEKCWKKKSWYKVRKIKRKNPKRFK